MNNKLYEELKEELKKGISTFDLNVQNVQAMEYVRTLLMSKLSEYNDKKDKVSIILAFYESTNHTVFSFLHNYYLEMFNSFFATSSLLKESFEDIIMNITLQNAFFVMGNNSLIMNLYEYAKNMSEENLHPMYKTFFNEIKTRCEKKGLINLISATDIPNKTVELKQQELNNEQEKLNEKQKSLNNFKEYKKEIIFKDAASSIGLNSNDLIKKAEKEGINPLMIDKIVVSDELIQMLSSKFAIASTVPKNIFVKIIVRTTQKSMLKSINLSVEEEKEISKLNITKTNDEFDKIASCGSEVLVTIRDSVKSIKASVALFVDASIETIKQALKNTSYKILKIEKAPVDFTIEDMQTKEQVDSRREVESMFVSHPEDNILISFENDLDNVTNSDVINTRKM